MARRTVETRKEAQLARAVLPVESVRRALRILGCFRFEHPERGVSEIARELRMHKSTVHRLLATLEAEGFVHQVDGSRYALSWKLFELGAAVPAWHGIRDAVVRVLRSLVERTHETAHLAILEEGEVLYLEKVESTQQLRMPSAVGRRVPVHCTALGKALIAGLPESSLNQILYGRPLRAYTANTITDPEILRDELRRFREDGYSVDREEIEEGLACIAAPVVDREGTTCGAISIAGPSPRIRARLEEHAHAVREAAAVLSRRLGPNAMRFREAWPSAGETL